jgi:hypothetical protein
MAKALAGLTHGERETEGSAKDKPSKFEILSLGPHLWFEILSSGMFMETFTNRLILVIKPGWCGELKLEPFTPTC